VPGDADRDHVAQFVAALQAEPWRSLRERRAFARPDGQDGALVHDFQGIRIDARDWPLLIMEMPEGPVGDDAVRAALAHLERVMEETPPGSRFFQLTDLSRMVRFAPASQRRYASEWTRRTDGLAARTRLGGVVVAPSPMLRAILTAVSWSKGGRSPSHVVSTREHGVIYAIQALEIAHPPLTPHLVTLRDSIKP
jgi:hypothetical protein